MRVFYLILSALIVSAFAQSPAGSSSGVADTGSTATPITPVVTSPAVTTPATPVVTSAATPAVTTPAPGTGTVPSAAPTTNTPALTTPSTPTVPPTTAEPAPAAQTWSINDTNNHACVIIQLAMKFDFIYNTTTSTNASITHYLPTNAVPSGTCNSSLTYQDMTLKWNDTFTLTLRFEKIGDPAKYDTYGLHSMNLLYSWKEEFFPDANPPKTPMNSTTEDLDSRDDSQFRINKGGSYKCNVATPLPFKQSGSDIIDVTGEASQFLFQAIDVPDDNTISDNYQECADDFGTSDIVPIAVGCALAALVVIVLIAYLIGRRRSRQKDMSATQLTTSEISEQ